MMMKSNRYRAVIWHGEAKSIYYLIKMNDCSDDAWEVVATFSTYPKCEKAAEAMNTYIGV